MAQARLATYRLRRDLYLAPVFRAMAPFLADLSITDIASRSRCWAAAGSWLARTFLIAVRTAERMALLRALAFRLLRRRFRDDLRFGTALLLFLP